MRIHRLRQLVAGVIVLAGVGTAVIWAQNAAPDPGSLGALVSEVRQLRLAVEESTRSQSQTQALGVYLSAEQSRIIQVSSRLDSVRGQLASAAAQTRQFATYLATAQTEVREAKTADDRAQAAGMVEMFKQQSDAAAAQEQQLRDREADLLQAFRAEEARWTDLVTKLEQLVRK